MQKDVILTPEGLEKLKDEIEYLSTEKRREVAERIKEAREFGDISENSEYDDAKNEQAMLEARIAALEEKLRAGHGDRRLRARHRTSCASARSSTSRTSRRQDDRVHDRRLDRGRPGQRASLSNESPVGKALLGHKKGETRRRARCPAARRASSRSPRSTSARTAMAAAACRDGDDRRPSSLAHAPAQARARCARPGSTRSRTRSRASSRSRTSRRRTRDLAAGEETEARCRVAGRLAARRGQGKAAFLDLVDRSGRIQLQARARRARRRAVGRGCSTLDLGDLIGVDGTVFRSRRGELSLRVDDFTRAGQVAAPAAGEAPRADRRRDALPPARARPDGQRGDARAVPHARAGRSPPIRALPRRRGLRRGRDAGAAADLRRRAGAAVHHPPQRARPRRSTCASRPSCTSSADRRRPRARLRARQGLPQRGPVAQAQPRVHDARVVRGLRGLQRRSPTRCERLVARVAQAAGYEGELDFAPPWRRETLREAIRERTGDRHPRAPRPRRAARRRCASRARGRPRGRRGPSSSTTCCPSTSSRRCIQPTFLLDYPVELSPFAKRHRSRATGLVERFEAFARRHGDRQRLHRAQRPRRPARALRGSSAPTPRPATRRPSPIDEAFLAALEHGMPPTGGIGIGHRPAGDAAHRPHSIREVVLFPAMRS